MLPIIFEISDNSMSQSNCVRNGSFTLKMVTEMLQPHLATCYKMTEMGQRTVVAVEMSHGMTLTVSLHQR